jgi:hypothetical protein
MYFQRRNYLTVQPLLPSQRHMQTRTNVALNTDTRGTTAVNPKLAVFRQHASQFHVRSFHVGSGRGSPSKRPCQIRVPTFTDSTSQRSCGDRAEPHFRLWGRDIARAARQSERRSLCERAVLWVDLETDDIRGLRIGAPARRKNGCLRHLQTISRESDT